MILKSGLQSEEEQLQQQQYENSGVLKVLK